MIQILGIDENFERSPLLMHGPFIENDVIDRDVHRVVRHRRFYFVGRPDEHLGTLEPFMHANDLSTIAAATLTLEFRFFNGFLADLLGNVVTDNFFVNLDHLKIFRSSPL